MTAKPSSHQRVRFAGLLILALGLVVAVMVYVGTSVGDGGDGTGDVTSQREMQQVERLGGTATVQTVQFNSWLGSLWHGQRLAWTIAILAVVLGGGFYYIGGLMGEEVDERA